MTTGPVRALTDDEVAHFVEKGWVIARNYIDPDYTAKMLASAKERLGVGDRPTENFAKSEGPSWFQHVDALAEQDPLFGNVILSEQTGRNVEKLLRRRVGVRVWADQLACKLPVSWGGPNKDTTYHQDAPHFPIDRTGIITCWFALDHIEPDQGSMRFYEGSHRSDYFGDPETWRSSYDILETYPFLQEYNLSEPLSYGPGDATFHHSQVVHGAPSNTANKPRFNYATAYCAADARFTGAACRETDGQNFEVMQPFPDSVFPLVWKGSEKVERVEERVA